MLYLPLSVRRLDARFLLSTTPRQALVLGGLDEWRDGLRSIGIETVTESECPDLVVAPARHASAAVALRPAAIILEGRRTSALRGTDYQFEWFLPRPRVADPTLLLPLGQPLASAYAVRHLSIVDRRWKAWRAAGAATLLERSIFPPIAEMVAAGSRDVSGPRIIRASQELGVPSDCSWFLTLGQGDALSRNVFHLFPPGSARPSWVLKFSRVQDYSEQFDREERGLKIVAGVREMQRHAPRLLGRLVVDGLHASLETAAGGRRLREILQGSSARAEKLALVEAIADWIVEFGAATALPADALEEERRRLADDVLPRWFAEGASPDYVTTLPPVPAVAQHNDLGSWNLVVTGADFTAVDWELARPHGLPLWDLLYFLADALAVIDGSITGENRHLHTRRLFRGDLEASKVLFRWVRRAVDRLSIPPEAVGSIATLCWLHHSLTHMGRSEILEDLTGSLPSALHGTELVASDWLADPALGVTWSCWRTS